FHQLLNLGGRELTAGIDEPGHRRIAPKADGEREILFPPGAEAEPWAAEEIHASDLLAQRRGESRVLDVTGVAHGGRLEDERRGFFVRYGAVLHAAGHDDEFARPERDDPPVAELDA